MKYFLPLLIALIIYACGPSTKESQTATKEEMPKKAKDLPVASGWSYIYGGTGKDIIYTIKPVSDGYILAGKTTSFGKGNYDALVIKLNKNGALQWTKTFGGLGYEDILSVTETMDGGYLLAGEAEKDILVIKLKKEGSMEWNKSISAPKWEFGTIALQQPDSSYQVWGATQSFGAKGFDIMVVPLDTKGEMNAPKKYTDKNEEIPVFYRQGDVGPLLTGIMRTPQANQVHLVQLTNTGQSLFTKQYKAGPAIAARLSTLPNETNLKETGTDNSNWFLLLDQSGAKLKERYYALKNKDFTPSGTALATDKGYLIAGTVNNNKLALIKQARWKDELEWVKELELGYGKAFQADIIRQPDSTFLIIGHVSNDGNWDIFIAKTNAEFNTENLEKVNKQVISEVEETLVQNYSARNLAPYNIKGKEDILNAITNLKGGHLYEFFEF